MEGGNFGDVPKSPFTASYSRSSRAVDAGWVVPHFEKMLYDNALLLRVYAEWGTAVGVWAAEGIADFLLAELRTAEGGFASALDADSEGAEGTYYVWTPAQLTEVPEDDLFAGIDRAAPAGPTGAPAGGSTHAGRRRQPIWSTITGQ
jgi:hypothetical protein